MARVINGQRVEEKSLRVASPQIAPSERTTLKVAFFFKEKNLLLNCEIEAKKGESALSAISRLNGVIIGTHASFGREIIGFDKFFMEGPALPNGYSIYGSQADRNFASQISSDQSKTGMGLEFQIKVDGKSGMPYVVGKDGEKIFLSLDQVGAADNMEIVFTVTSRQAEQGGGGQNPPEHDSKLATHLPPDFNSRIFSTFQMSDALSGLFSPLFDQIFGNGAQNFRNISFSIGKIARPAEYGRHFFDYRKFGPQNEAVQLFDLNHRRRLEIASERLLSDGKIQHQSISQFISFAPQGSASSSLSQWQDSDGGESGEFHGDTRAGLPSRIASPAFDSTPAFNFSTPQNETLASKSAISEGVKIPEIGGQKQKSAKKEKNSLTAKNSPRSVSTSAKTSLSSSRIRAVIFDMDGVLANSEPLHMKTFQQIVRPYGAKISKDYYMANYIGTGSRHIIEDVFSKNHISANVDSLVQERMMLFQRLVEQGQLHPMPGALELVKLAKKQGMKTIVASGGHRTNVKAQLSSLGLEGMPAIALEDVTRRKPHPEAFLAAAEAVGVPPAQCLVIEDSKAGVLAARRAGMPVLLVSRHQSQKVRAMATKSVSSLDTKSLHGWLLGLFSGKNETGKKRKKSPVTYTPARKK